MTSENGVFFFFDTLLFRYVQEQLSVWQLLS